MNMNMTREEDETQHQRQGDSTAKTNTVQVGIEIGGIIAMEASEGESGIPIDAATTSSDAAVVLPPPPEYLRPNNKVMIGNSGGGSSSSEQRQPSYSSSGIEVPDSAAAALAGGQHYIHAHARRRHHHHRKRALSKANSSGTIETNGSMAVAEDDENGRRSSNNNSNNQHNGQHQLSSSGGGSSLMNSSTIGSNIMSGRGEHSIVSFGRNFNFDSTSSPSNSDSGEGAVNDGKGGGGEGSNSDDDSKNRNSKPSGDGGDGIPSILLNTTMGGDERQTKKIKHNTHHRRGGGNKCEGNTPLNNTISLPQDSSGNDACNRGGGGAAAAAAKKSKKNSQSSSKQNANVKFVQEVMTGENHIATKEGSGSSSTSSGSDSSMNDMNNDYGGSASGGSNSGNDGSSGGKSTISSLTTSSNAEWMASNEKGNVVRVAPSSMSDAGVQSRVEMGQSDGANNAAKNDIVTSKKRKKSNCGLGHNEESHKSEEDDDDGYKTDEEQWGGNHHIDDLPASKGSSPKATASNDLVKQTSTNSMAPPAKQARFSVDHNEVMTQPLSSLSGSDSAGNPGAVTNSSTSPSNLSKPSKPLAVDMTTGPNHSRGVSEPSSDGFAIKVSKHNLAQGSGVEPDKRKERNAREKERSCRIARQIDDLRALLSRGGVVVSKGTKSSVLSEAANYISLLQQQQVQWEMERQALMQQMQQGRVIPNPILKQPVLQQSATSMSSSIVGGSSGMPQQMSLNVQPSITVQNGYLQMNTVPPPEALPTASTAIAQNDYKFIFDNTSVGMAIASLGGAFIDCNSIFCQLSEYTKEEVCAMTIFNMTSRQDLQHAFDLISQMITPALDNGSDKGEDKSSIVLRGAMKKRTDLGLNISLIKGEHGIVKCFCVTLIRILSIKSTRPDTVSIEMELPQICYTKQQKNVGLGSSPAYTAG